VVADDDLVAAVERELRACVDEEVVPGTGDLRRGVVEGDLVDLER